MPGDGNDRARLVLLDEFIHGCLPDVGGVFVALFGESPVGAVDDGGFVAHLQGGRRGDFLLGGVVVLAGHRVFITDAVEVFQQRTGFRRGIVRDGFVNHQPIGGLRRGLGQEGNIRLGVDPGGFGRL